jgi:acyl-CoA synthetase (NDP forming)
MRAEAARIEKIFERAEKAGRSFLFEHEVYALLRSIGFETPRHIFIKKGQKAHYRKLASLRSREVVLKIVSPQFVHKTEVGGVVFVENEASTVNQAIARLLADVPERFAAGNEESNRAGTAATAADIRGVLVLEKVRYSDFGFGSELLLGIRHSREFGPVITIGLGGLDVEYVAEKLRPRQAVAVHSAHLRDKKAIIERLRTLAFYDKLVRGFRGAEPLIGENDLIAACECFLELGARFSPYAVGSSYVIEEAEVNPFVIRGGKLVPLDGMCRFSRRHEKLRPDIYGHLGALLRPRSIGIIGVSERLNLGRIILRNILREGFPKDRVYVIKPGLREIEGCRCLPDVSDLPETVDIFILTLSAEQSVGFMEELVRTEKARSVIIIAGGMGEKEGTEELEVRIKKLLRDARASGKPVPVVNGGNSMGVYSAPGRYDTTFIPDYKLASPGKTNPRLVYISQSGAFMASRMSKLPSGEPLYAISLGNQIDLTASDYLNYLAEEEAASLFALYIEGFEPGDGLALAQAARKAVRNGKTVLVYKSGRSPEGRLATSSHTASVAGDYVVCRDVLESVGAFVAETLTEFEFALRVLPALEGKIPEGRRVGLVSNAGFECVILADNLKNGDSLELASLSPGTRAAISGLLQPLGIDRLQDVKNPLDLTPVADDAVFAGCVAALLADTGVDCAVVSPVPMTSALQTLAPSGAHRENIHSPHSIGRRLVEIFRKTAKPFVVSIDAGSLYDPLASLLEDAGVPVFRRSDEALRFLAKYVRTAARSKKLRRKK